jgi:hypothetical protein
MTRKQKDKVGDSKRYHQWERLQRIKKMVEKDPNLTEAKAKRKTSIAPDDLDVGQFSKRYKHSDPTQVTKKRLVAALINKGFNPEMDPVTATKQHKFGKHKVSVGKRAYAPVPLGHMKFREITLGDGSGRTKTIRKLKKKKEYRGKEFHMNSYETEYNNYIQEQEPKSDEQKENDLPVKNDKVSKLVNKNKAIKHAMKQTAKGKPHDEIKLPRTMTGEKKDTNVLEINPTLASKK